MHSQVPSRLHVPLPLQVLEARQLTTKEDEVLHLLFVNLLGADLDC